MIQFEHVIKEQEKEIERLKNCTNCHFDGITIDPDGGWECGYNGDYKCDKYKCDNWQPKE